MDNNFGNVLTAARSVLFLLPQNPRLDWVASALALADSLQKSGKSTHVVCPSPMTVEFSRLVGVEKINDRVGDKNLIIRFPGYDSQGIDTVTYNTDGGQFELVVVTKDGSTPPSPAQLQLSYSGVSADVVLLIGVSDRGQMGKLDKDEIFQGQKLIFLGNREPPASIPLQFSLSVPGAASLSQLIVKFLESQNLPFDQDIASGLLYGIEVATDNFLSTATSAETFEAAAACLHRGATRHTREIRTAKGAPGPWRRPKDQWPQPPQQPTVSPQQPPAQIPPQPILPTAPSVPQPSQPAPQSPQQPPFPPPRPQQTQPAPQASPEWLEPKIYTGRTIV